MKMRTSWHRVFLGIGCYSLALTVAAGAPHSAIGLPDDEQIQSPSPLEVVQRDLLGRPQWITGELGVLDRGDMGSAAILRVKAMAQELGGSGWEDLEVLWVQEDPYGKTHIRLAQLYNGLPVLAPDVIVHADTASGRVSSVQGRLISIVGEEALLAPKITEVEAVAAAQGRSVAKVEALGPGELVYFPSGEGRMDLAWKIDLGSPGSEPFRYLISAADGSVLDARSLLAHALDRTVFDAQQSIPSIHPPDPILIQEGGQPTADPEGQAAYNHMEAWFDYFLNIHGHDSIDGGGFHPEWSFVHVFYTNPPVGPNVVAFDTNCSWNSPAGSPRPCFAMFGDGDGVTYGSFALDRDAVVHEMTHGVSHFYRIRTNDGEIGAVNEALSDIFAAALDAHYGNGVTTGTWRIAEQSALVPFGSCNAIRCLDNPTIDGRSKDYYPDADFCGSGADPHDNAGMASLAFYLLSQGGSHPRGVTTHQVQGMGISNAAQVFFQAYQYLPGGQFPTCNNGVTQPFYEPLRQATAQAAVDIFGAGTAEWEAVHAAWCAVGVPGCPLPNQPPEANDDSFSVPVGSPSHALSFGQLLANDSDPNGDPLFVVAGTFGQPSCGSLTELSNQIVYTPSQAFWDGCAESFTYQVSDRAPGNGGLTDTASISFQPAFEASLFADGFESNSISAWSSSGTTGSGSLLTSIGASLVGTYGLSAKISGTGKAYVRDDSPNDETRYRARFHFDPTSLTMGSFDAHSIFNAYDSGGTSVLALSVRSGQLVREVSARVLRDDGTWAATGWTPVIGATYLEISWIASSAVGASDGEIRLWVGGTETSLSSLDTDQRRIDSVRLGLVGGVDPGTKGDHHIDA
ncbi:MAG: M4 family metallopeptidase, partial [Deltaproteobacteria bacterium]|nr:M4 family metallopeptidase [Deltaproteobacteria bacterium]